MRKITLATLLLSASVTAAQAQEFPAGYVPAASATIKVSPEGEVLPRIASPNDLNPEKVDAFNQVVDREFLGPELTRQTRRFQEANERALYERPTPMAHTGEANVSLEPGETLRNVDVTPGNVTLISFFDVSGAPWPITQFMPGDTGSYSVQPFGADGENVHTLAVSALRLTGNTNMAVALADLDLHVNIQLNTSERSYDAVKNIYVDHVGPNATVNTATAETVMEAGSGTLLDVLSGVDLPDGFQPLAVDLPSTRAWMFGDHIYIRSRYPLMSPSPIESISGNGGFYAYKISERARAVFFKDGRGVHAAIELP